MKPKYLQEFETEALFEAAKSTLPDPWVTLTDDDKKVHYKEIAISYAIKQGSITSPTVNWDETSATIEFVGLKTVGDVTTEIPVSQVVTFPMNGQPVDYTTGGELVDLGLPSRLLWARCNLGAKTESEYGLYFAWGETEGYPTAGAGTPIQRTGTLQWEGCDVIWKVNQKGFGKNFRWADYKYCQGTNTTLTKYNTSSSYGTVDNKTQLEDSDDAIIAHAGATTGTRMPTTAEWKELYNNTTNEWVTIGDVKGRKFTSKTDSSKYIFIPASGYASSGSVYNVGSYGYVWSSSLYSSHPYYAYYMYFNSSGVYPQYDDDFRCLGFSVRGVSQ